MSSENRRDFMQIQVISLKTAKDRRNHILSEFGQQNINFQFFDALTPEMALKLSTNMNLGFNHDRLTGGELACFMSHVSLWKKMVVENIPYMAIFEDDVFLGKNVTNFFNSSEWIDKDCHIIKTEFFTRKIIVGQAKKIESTTRHIAQLKSKNLGTAGYILSLEGAMSYLRYIENNELIPLDEMMFDHYIKANELPVHQTFPALCIQEMMLYPDKKTNLASDLLAERKARMQKFKKKGVDKVKQELLRIIDQLRNLFFAKNNTFE